MSILVLAEHDNSALRSATFNAVAAAAEIGGDIHVLVAGNSCAAVAEEAAKIAGVGKVFLAEAAHLGHDLAENVATLLVKLAEGYTHVVAAATTYGKNTMPRAAALLDVQQISDITEIVSPDTFVRPIYAGNALATVRSGDAIKLLTVRTTSFEAVAAEGGSAAVEQLAATDEAGLSSFVGEELSKS